MQVELLQILLSYLLKNKQKTFKIILFAYIFILFRFFGGSGGAFYWIPKFKVFPKFVKFSLSFE
jgi:hypothetical protein